jgi:hypothetical protein
MNSLLSFQRLARRASTEIAVALSSVAAAIQLFILREPVLALGVLATGALTCAIAIAVLVQRGELQLAWRCPRLDRLGVELPSPDAPWSALLAVDSALAALDEASRRYPAFFPDGRRDLLRGVGRALDLHRLQTRSLAEASRLPEGLPRRSLQLRATRAGEELHQLERSLGEIRSRLVEASTAPHCEEGEMALSTLAERTTALADAVTEINARDGVRDVIRAFPLGERA